MLKKVITAKSILEEYENFYHQSFDKVKISRSKTSILSFKVHLLFTGKLICDLICISFIICINLLKLKLIQKYTAQYL